MSDKEYHERLKKIAAYDREGRELRRKLKELLSFPMDNGNKKPIPKRNR